MTPFDAKAVQGLRAVLDTLTRGDAARAELAEKHLHEAARDFLNSFTVVDGRGKTSRPSLSEARASVAKLAKNLAAALAAAQDLPVNAIAAVAGALDTSIGALTKDLGRMVMAADTALRALTLLPNKPSDHDRTALAFMVARVVRHQLGLNVASTRDTNINVTGKRGGAAYAQVLRSTLRLAGVRTPDLGPLIDHGKKMLEDPEERLPKL